MKVTSANVADAARRMKWPSRLGSDDTAESEIAPRDTTARAVPPIDAAAFEAVVKMAVPPLQAVIDLLVEDARASRADVETLRLERDAAWADAAGLREKTTVTE